MLWDDKEGLAKEEYEERDFDFFWGSGNNRSSGWEGGECKRAGARRSRRGMERGKKEKKGGESSDTTGGRQRFETKQRSGRKGKRGKKGLKGRRKVKGLRKTMQKHRLKERD